MKNEINLFDIVRLKTDINRYCLRKGTVGTVIYSYNNMYEVEFITHGGLTIDSCPIAKDSVEKIPDENLTGIRKQTIFVY